MCDEAELHPPVAWGEVQERRPEEAMATGTEACPNRRGEEP